VQGEEVQKLDEFANNVIMRSVEAGGHLCVMASEENDDVIRIPDQFPTGKYVLMFDPLDGSSNIDVDINIGTIFSIHRRVTVGRTAARRLPPAGRVAGRRGLRHLRLEHGARVLHGRRRARLHARPGVGEFFLSHENIRIPQEGEDLLGQRGQLAALARGACAAGPTCRPRSPTPTAPVDAVLRALRRLAGGGLSPHAAQGRRVRVPRGRRAPRASCGCSTRPPRWRSSARPQAAPRATGTQRILDVERRRSCTSARRSTSGSAEDVAEAERFLREES
jgi:fructose-1,6-bisphosphatase